VAGGHEERRIEGIKEAGLTPFFHDPIFSTTSKRQA